MIRIAVVACALLSTHVTGVAPARAADAAPVLDTNQSYIEQAGETRPIDITDLFSVFRFVFAALPDRVTVYPTENYYYFKFFHDGTEFAGNIRLDASDRDKGIVHFAYFSAYALWNQELESRYRAMTAEDGVVLEKTGPLTYTIGFEGRTVTFDLNDLTNVRPPPGMLRSDERYIGPVFDESGVELFLVFNTTLRIFHYLLNENGPAAEVLNTSGVSDRIWIGHRTGFAYYADRLRNRKILIGVYNPNSVVNNYFDGPFDQLPDNFIQGDTLKDALEAAYPSIKGQIDRFGNAAGGQTRILITPYIHYDAQYELQYFSDCADQAGEDEEAYYACFAVEETDDADDAAADEADSADTDDAADSN